MTEEELAIIAARTEDATAGPWTAMRMTAHHSAGSTICLETCGRGEVPLSTTRETWGECHLMSFDHIDDIISANRDHVVCCGGHGYDDSGYVSVPDAEFIAHAREDIPRLLEEVARLRRIVWGHR